MSTIFEELENLKPEDVGKHSQLALEWFRTNIRRIFDRRQNEKIYLDGTKVGNIIEGNMYMMFYDAKTKAKLPWFDRFPLIIPFDTRTVDSGFYAINLHYIPPMARQDLLEELYKRPTETGVEVDYNYFQAVSRLNPALPCVKRYLYSRIKRVPMEIQKDYWDVAAMLPTADFGRVNTNTVYANSRKQI